MVLRFLLLAFLCLFFTCTWAEESIESLLNALEITQAIDEKLCERFPITFNHLLSTGYFTTPSARMTEEGEIGIGMANVPPYLHMNARMQPFWFLELSANYRIFKGVEDRGLSPSGFGDYADRGANFKAAIITPEDSHYMLPGIAFGVEDFMGSKKFKNYFVVGTQIFPSYGIEISFGWGAGRYTHGPSRGFFGAFNWFPFLNCEHSWLKQSAFSAEYDPIDYANPEREPHPDGGVSNFPVNFGVKYKFRKLFELSLSCIRGADFAIAGSFHYNWGTTTGLVPKIGDPLPYSSPKDFEPLGVNRPESVMIQNLNYSLEDQGFQLTKAWIQTREDRNGCLNKCLVLRLMNCRYRQEHIVRMRLQHLLAALLPIDIDKVIVVTESYGVAVQEYEYDRSMLFLFQCQQICPYEFDVVSPRREVSCVPALDSKRIFQQRYDLWKFQLSPRVENFFGSASGKYKYDIGLKAGLEGFLPYSCYYEAAASYTLISDIHKIGDYDLYNPSQLPNVATDFIRYRQDHAFSLDKLYAQKSTNHGRGLFSRAALGYFQVNYAGAAGELLWYPAKSCFAFGIEGAIVKKRSYHGLGFQDKLRKLDGYTPTYISYNFLEQYFLSAYLDFPALNIFTKISAGQFLARDKGFRLEATRYFNNGVRLTGWITFTDAADMMHGENYYDRGISIEIPFDLFYKCSSRRVWSYGLAAWLRDAGYSTSTGRPLFEIINRERRW